VKAQHLQTLKQIALMGGIHDFVTISSSGLGRTMSISQQSASKRILELLDMGLMSRDLGIRAQRLKLTKQGVEVLTREYADYKKIFELKDRLTISGTVTTGLGEGQYYITQKEYKEQFEEKLWFQPYEGTLNIKLGSSDVFKLNILEDSEGILIKGFESKGRSFGDVKCFPAKMRNVECAVIMPVRSHHTDVLEVISKHHLRSTLDVEDGNIVELTVFL
jgi:riboflavin kinase